MTRSEAAKICQSIKFILENSDYTEAVEEALNMAIEALEQEPKWIPVTERLPEEGLAVLIFTESGDIEFGQRDENKWEWLAESISDYWTRAEEVIAWQPLPEPYEESDGE